jgi:phosphate transport system protein
MSDRAHSRKHYEERLRSLKEKLLLMGHKAETMVSDSIRAYEERRLSLAQEVIQRDRELDLLEREIDEHCLEILALDQPVADDLRRVTSAFKMVKDLERIGDHSVIIAERAIESLHEPELESGAGIGIMAIETQKILKDSLDSLVFADVALAETVIHTDRVIDVQYEHVFHDQLSWMSKERAAISRALGLILVARSLERIGDHSVNIAEMVIFLAKGQDIRHGTHAAAPSLRERMPVEAVPTGR